VIIMRTTTTCFILLLFLALALGACAPAPTEPGAAAPTEAATTVPAPEQATATSEPAAEPTATAEPAEPTATAEPAEPETPAAFCPEIGRPALILFHPADQLLLFDPASGESCALPIPGRYIGMVALTDSAYFSPAPMATGEGDATVIQRYLPDGTVEDLAYTVSGAGASYTGFAVSEDARLIAWGIIGPEPGSDFPTTSLHVASLETGELLATVGPVSSIQPRGLMPIRFDESGSTLFYAEQPYGIGGSWIAFNGRYDTLYAVATDGSGEVEMVFDCGGGGLGLCLGDFFVVDGAVTGLAYVDGPAGTVIVANGAGEVINTVPVAEEYVGFPTWGPGGELVFYSADFAESSDGPPAPAMGHLHRVAPPTAPAETLLSDPALVLPVGFLDESRVVVNWFGEPETQVWGLAIIGIDGSLEILDVPTGTAVTGIVR
jgi:hypothetical protein